MIDCTAGEVTFGAGFVPVGGGVLSVGVDCGAVFGGTVTVAARAATAKAVMSINMTNKKLYL